MPDRRSRPLRSHSLTWQQPRSLSVTIMSRILLNIRSAPRNILDVEMQTLSHQSEVLPFSLPETHSVLSSQISPSMSVARSGSLDVELIADNGDDLSTGQETGQSDSDVSARRSMTAGIKNGT